MNRDEYRRMFNAEDCHWWYVSLHELILSTVASEAARKGRLQIFDAGCGTGRLMQLLAPYGEIRGCDLSSEAITFCAERGLTGITQSSLAEMKLPADHFDVITCIDVLYHRGIADDIAILERLRAALKPGGLLIIHLVAGPNLYSSHDIAVHTRERYTRTLLQGRLEGAGLQIEKLSYRLTTLYPLIALWRRLKRQQPARDDKEVVSDVSLPPPLINGLLFALMRLENRLLRAVDLPCGSSLFALCRRPR